jgi:large subunit ribosomal protein L19e
VDHVFAILTGQNIRKLVKDGFIIKKPQKIHSRSRARRAHEAKQKGRHSGYGMLLQLIYVIVFKDGSTCANLMSL